MFALEEYEVNLDFDESLTFSIDELLNNNIIPYIYTSLNDLNTLILLNRLKYYLKNYKIRSSINLHAIFNSLTHWISTDYQLYYNMNNFLNTKKPINLMYLPTVDDIHTFYKIENKKIEIKTNLGMSSENNVYFYIIKQFYISEYILRKYFNPRKG